jgi:very-short-patch-repair endonuclease
MYNCEYCKKNFNNKGAYSRHIETCKNVNNIKDEIYQLYVDEFWSINKLKKKFNVGSNTIVQILGNSKKTKSESIKIAHENYPDRFKHTEKTKKILREKRLKFMKDNPDKTAWRLKNISYPEKLFYDKLIELSWDRKYSIKREYSVFPYFIDFAFLNEKIAVEIDGSQHLIPERKLKDDEKNKLLISKGWGVVRISENKIKTDIENVFDEILRILNKSINAKIHKVGIVLHPKKYQKKPRKNGLTKEQLNSFNSQRKVNRPDYETLINEVNDLGFVKTGKKYGVSDNTIRKWVKFYEKYEN